MSLNPPLVLLVDDKPEAYAVSMGSALSTNGALSVQVLHPADVLAEHLAKASLILIDYKLESWPSRDELAELALRPADGIALAAVLRRYVADGSAAFALISSSVQDAFHEVSERNRRHQLARVESLEWVFEKTDPEIAGQILALARAAQSLQERGPVTAETLAATLAIPNGPESVSAVAMSDVRRCIPPLADLERMTSGRAFVRWLLQRVLPYPTFLIDDLHLAARLGISRCSLERIVDQRSELAQILDTARYTGVLGGFQGRRWWKAALDEIMWTISEMGVLSRSALHDKIRGMTSPDVEFVSAADPVVVVDEDVLPTGDLVERASCVRLLPDDWPAYADPAYYEIARMSANPEMEALVHPDDQWRLKEDG